MVWLEGHPATGDVLRGVADGREGVSELDGRRYQFLEGRGRRRALGGRRGDGLGARGEGGRGGVFAAAAILAADAELPGHEGQILILREAHLEEGESQHQTPPSHHLLFLLLL